MQTAALILAGQKAQRIRDKVRDVAKTLGYEIAITYTLSDDYLNQYRNLLADALREGVDHAIFLACADRDGYEAIHFIKTRYPGDVLNHLNALQRARMRAAD